MTQVVHAPPLPQAPAALPAVPSGPPAHRPADPGPDGLLLHGLHGYNPSSFICLGQPETRLYRDPALEGAVPYRSLGRGPLRVWLASADPLTSPEALGALCASFAAAARRAGATPAFAPVTARVARHARGMGLQAVRLGATPYLELPEWRPRGNAAKTLRGNLNRARRAGLEVSEADPQDRVVRAELSALSASWLRTRRAGTPLGWVLALDPLRHPGLRRVFVARMPDPAGAVGDGAVGDGAAGVAVAFLSASPLPARGGWYLEDVVRAPGAPDGAAALLVTNAAAQLGRDGARCVTLGCTPLCSPPELQPEVPCHPLLSHLLGRVSPLAGRWYSHQGLYRFKRQFVPTRWESEYVLLPGTLSAPLVAWAMLRAALPQGLGALLRRRRDA